MVLFLFWLIMAEENKIQLFEGQQVRYVWDAEKEKYFFSVVDVIKVLTDSENPRRYWSDLKRKLEAEGSEVYEKIVQLKMPAPSTTGTRIRRYRYLEQASPEFHPVSRGVAI